MVLGINRRELFSPDFDSTATSNSLSPDPLLAEDRLDDDEFDQKTETRNVRARERKPFQTCLPLCTNFIVFLICCYYYYCLFVCLFVVLLSQAHTHVRSEPDEVSQFLDLPERRAASATDGIRSATPPDTAKPKTQTHSGMNFLSRTRSDEPARGDVGVSGGGVTIHNLRHVESTSEETLVGSSSHQDLHLSR